MAGSFRVHDRAAALSSDPFGLEAHSETVVVQVGFGLLDRSLDKLRFLIVRTRFERPVSQPIAGVSVPGYK